MKVLMLPQPPDLVGSESGIRRVIDAYFKTLPELGIELVGKDAQSYDLKVVHAGMAGGDCSVSMLHGIYLSSEYDSPAWEYKSNKAIVESIRSAREVTVPSSWVAEIFQRDMHFTPHVIGHGIEWDEWQEQAQSPGQEDYILHNKNRVGDVCSPEAVGVLASRFPSLLFVSTFAPQRMTPNVKVTGVVPHQTMKGIVQGCAVYLSTTKETFGIGILEGMASARPILGFAEGGILGLVRHGVNGYLAMPGDMDDLAAGLAWCLEHGRIAGANGREMAKAFTWRKACEKLAAVFEKAMKPEPPTVSIVIPSFMYSSKVGRAIESALRQTYPLLESVVVVDDGSPDEGATRKVVEEWIGKDARVRYVRQEHSGVAVARNLGFASISSKYVLPLDADDAIEPAFLAATVPAMEADRSLGVTYTGIRWLDKEGKTGVSAWPGPWVFDAFLERKNQVPTCALVRREAWKRLGGYRQRYAPTGAGAEDAEFFLRLGAMGWKGAKVTDEPLFLYSMNQGHTSQPDYKEVNWLKDKPWSQDGQHPLASWATPQRMSHPVRSYDQPLISVVIPVGPKHLKAVIDALDSLEAQTERKWEAVLVDDTGGEARHLLDAYPFVRYFQTPKAGSGAGKARNVGAAQARAPFLLFLDADDYLLPDCLTRMVQAWRATGAGVYTDYIGIADVKDPNKLAPGLKEAIKERHGDVTYISYRAAEYDCLRAQAQPDGPRPYLWCNVTTLIPTSWHAETGGFDEGLESWEDVLYWWKLARLGKCFVRIPEELMVYDFRTGGRRQEGLDNFADLLPRLAEKVKGVKIMPCSNCPRTAPAMPPPPAMPRGGAMNVQDSALVLCKYKHQNIGQHPVVGAQTRTSYGYRSGGDEFLVNREDIRATPHLFEPLESLQPPQQQPTRFAGMAQAQAEVPIPPSPTPLVSESAEAIPATKTPRKAKKEREAVELKRGGGPS